jgi:hypothetical protein
LAAALREFVLSSAAAMKPFWIRVNAISSRKQTAAAREMPHLLRRLPSLLAFSFSILSASACGGDEGFYCPIEMTASS